MHKKTLGPSNEYVDVFNRARCLTFFYIHPLCMRAKKDLVSLRIYTGSPVPSISTIISCTESYSLFFYHRNGHEMTLEYVAISCIEYDAKMMF